MAVFSVRVPDDLARRFDVTAAQAGGRSALLRRLIAAQASPAPGDGPRPAALRRSAARVMVRLAAPDAAVLDREAAAMGLSRAGWIAALVRRRVGARPGFGPADGLVLIAIQGELRRIGVNLNQIARALNTAVLEGRVLELELAFARDLRDELRHHLRSLRQGLEGNLSYWEIEP